MRLLVFLILFLPLASQGHQKPLSKRFLVTIKPGPKWDQKLAEKDQQKMAEHIRFLKKLYRDGKILIAARFSEKNEALLIINKSSKKEVTDLLAKDPVIANRLFSFSLEPIYVNMIGKDDPHKH